MTDEDIISSAMFHGFMISTAYGQEPGKLMPVTDRATLIKFAREIIRFSQLNIDPIFLCDDNKKVKDEH